ncbi:hypothetical protein [Psychroserpens ponticola]|uniref:Anti-sigma factor n=1 Tax=Psychroserpens ponticola TaxID=2932268 RepID=A0ABY7RYG3_9FLAO|nr:hypothetical protein [Psychroserpens ponticola]WCO02170.1 hypothetical protein MUN68_001470 [Psychroserpens ponticola]
MAPIKFEDKLKDKLENRTLEPTLAAWNTLADRLDKEEKTNNNTRFWWIGIAASIVGVILVTTQFYKSSTTEDVLPIVVETNTGTQSETELIPEPNPVENIVTNTALENKNTEKINATKVASASNNKTLNTQKVVKEKKNLLQEEPENVMASVQNDKTKRNDNSPVEVLSNEDLKIIEVVNVIKQLQTNESSVTDKEIDSLLKQAQREILKQRIYDETTRTVDADALLQDVEVELEQSFRDKVFKALKSSYTSVKTAVAERRN